MKIIPVINGQTLRTLEFLGKERIGMGSSLAAIRAYAYRCLGSEGDTVTICIHLEDSIPLDTLSEQKLQQLRSDKAMKRVVGVATAKAKLQGSAVTVSIDAEFEFHLSDARNLSLDAFGWAFNELFEDLGIPHEPVYFSKEKQRVMNAA